MSVPSASLVRPQGRTRIAVLDDYQGVALQSADWARLGPDVDITVFREHLEGEILSKALQGFEVVVAMRERTAFPAELLAALPDLRLLASTGMQNAAIDVAACEARGVLVCGSARPDVPVPATAELTWALIFAITKRLPEQEAALRAGLWQTDICDSLHGKVLGVVGLGKLGTSVARVGAIFGMEVIAWSPNLDDARATAAGARRVDKATLFSTADVVTVHMVLSERTHHLAARADLESMKPSASFINTSRAGLVDMDALRELLNARRIYAAGLDVFPKEPMPADDPWTRQAHCVLTPHLGYVTHDTYAAFYGGVIDNIIKWRNGEPVRRIKVR